MYLIKEFKTYNKEYHKLSGVVLIVDDKVCLVLPKKFKGTKKYSIPKGHIEPNLNEYENALTELKEETGIKIKNKKYDDNFIYKYNKNGVSKVMSVYVIKMTQGEYDSIPKKKRDKKEISKVKFVDKKDALNLVENRFKKLIKQIYK